MSNLEKRHLSAEEKQRIITEWKQSGLSKKQFAEQAGLKYYSFVSWFGAKKKKPVPGFEQVKISAPDQLFAEVIIANRTIRFFQPFPAEYFQWLVK